MYREHSNSKTAEGEDKSQSSNGIKVPSISLPKGGGAIRGIGEKFSANPVTGTGSMSVPVATTSSRSGFNLQLSLSYDSGAGNGPFGLGWDLSLPAIRRKTDKGLPKYQDAQESDVFILSGAEDLVPVGSAFDDVSQRYKIQRYQPRIEGSFARIERWSNKEDVSDVFWRTVSKENITTWYGKTAESRIADPANADRIFSWLTCESYDDKGNAIAYEYVAEDNTGVDLSKTNERNRSRTANRYLRRIKYGNTPSRLEANFSSVVTWHFEVLFDYGIGIYREDLPDANGNVYAHLKTQPPAAVNWPARSDPHSSYRAGFEVRTHRLCRRILMFHRFDELLLNESQLVRSTEIAYATDPIAARVLSITHCSYVPAPGAMGSPGERRYLKKTLPPVEFTYTEPVIDGTTRDVDAESLENLPYGVDGAAYRWVDLEGEGLEGILSEQADGWFYKRNLAPINLEPDEDGVERSRAKLGPVELVDKRPNLTITGTAQFMDLAGDGRPDLVVLDGPIPGFYEHDDDGSWQPFQTFTSRLTRNIHDPNLRFVDLDGDGHADVLITEDDAFTWHSSLGEEGFGSAQRVAKARDEEAGPALVFADVTQSIYLADISGDGLTDLVRIRNGEICYWPNLGYGRFGAKVTMDNSPWFDAPELFDQRRLHLADIDGSGVTDIVYLHGDGVRIYFNESGNSWSIAHEVPGLPRIDNSSSVTVIDLLGNGTSCLVWSSPLAGNATRPMKYVDLMSGQKPHLLVSVRNNLGTTTAIEYAPSTRFYLQDKLAGTPWITRLPFPVHCVAKVVVTDKWRKTRFASTYSYHHGYFDGDEREFRGFDRVEQIDTEGYSKFLEGNVATPHITDDPTLYQPPVKTITWYHTGAAIDRSRILTQFAHEYFPQRFADRLPDPAVPDAFREKPLPEPELPDGLSDEEWREALRACKGMPLRQEIYELDVDDLAAVVPAQTPVRIFSAVTHNCHIQLLQARGNNQHAVFLVTESEALNYHYELSLRESGPLEPDPRITHTLNLKIDEFGNVLQSASAVYPRRGVNDDQSLSDDQRALIHRVQNEERHLALNCTDFTKDNFAPETYRLPVLYQTRLWEITGLTPAGDYFTVAELKSRNLVGTGAAEISYHEVADGMTIQKRLIECGRNLFFDGDLATHLDFGLQGPLSLPYESYKLALTKDLIDRVLVDSDRLSTAYAALDEQVNGHRVSGYYKGDQLFPNDPITPAPLAEQYWMASGRAGYNSDAARHFYLPERYTDPFGNMTTLVYDGKYDLFLQSSTDARGNTTRVERFDYRVMAPNETVDLNDNHTEVYYNALGLVVATASKGKQINGQWEGDNLDGFTDALANPFPADVVNFCASPTFNDEQARTWLGNASTRFVYHFGERIDTGGQIIWNAGLPGACNIARERHASQFALEPLQKTPLQVSLECSDGAGNVLMKKVQAEPNPTNGQTRWIVNGLTVLNNKSKPVKQYEPAFSDKFGCELPQANGVTTTTYYDAVGRVMRVDMPDGTFTRVEFSPWEVLSYDQNDTAYDPDPTRRSDWYNRRTDPAHPRFEEFNSPDDRRSAELVEIHANTPTVTFLDTLGRNAISVEHNKYQDRSGTLHDEKHLTFTKLDAEGKPLWIRDARRNLVMQYITPIKPTSASDDDMPLNSVPCYDIAGNLMFQHGMDTGDRWTLNDAAGRAMLAWDRNDRQTGTTLTVEERQYRTKYDALHRPIEQWLSVDGTRPALIERFEYLDTDDADPNGDTVKNNLRGQLVQHYDPSGLTTLVRISFKGNPEEVHRTLTNQYKASIIDWQGSQKALALRLEDESFVQIASHDALGRITQRYNWHRDVADSRVAVYVPSYNERGILLSETLDVGATKTRDGHIPSGKPLTNAIAEIRYNAKGQKTYLKLGNGSVSRYTYDAETFRLRRLYTRRDARFTADCGAEPPPPRTAAPDVDSPPRSCGVQNLSYTYDPVGNITHIQDDAQQTIYFQNARVEPSNDYVYDTLYRLIGATGREDALLTEPPAQIEGPPVSAQFPITGDTLRNYAEFYRYDSAGNLEEIEHVANTKGQGAWTRHFEYATDSNRLLRTWHGDPDWDSPNAKDKISHSFDTHGNMLNVAPVAANQFLRWDYRDLLAGIDLVGGGLAFYAYDSSKKRTRKRIDKQNSTTGYWERIYLEGYELYRRYSAVDSTTPVEEIESHHVFEGKQRVLLVEDVITSGSFGLPRKGFTVTPQTLFRYQYSNHLGSVSLELNEQAQIISYEEYHPYGTSAYRAVQSAIEVAPKRYRYTGMERDEESGLSYHTARYYLCWLARWASADSAGLVDGPNIYCYVRDNPITRNDTNGNLLDVVPVPPPTLAPAPMALPSPTVATGAVEFGIGEAEAEVGAAAGLGEAMELLGPLAIAIAVLSIVSTQRYMQRTASLVQYGNPYGMPKEKLFHPELEDIRAANDLRWKRQQIANPSPVPEIDPVTDTVKRPPKTGPKTKTDPKEPGQNLGRVYVTYTKFNIKTGQYYSGRTSAVIDLDLPITPQAVAAVAARDANHHIDENDEPKDPSFLPAHIDKHTVGLAVDYRYRYTDPGYLAIRGREQQLIDHFGGAQSDTHPDPPRTENPIRAVAKDNPLGELFNTSANIWFNTNEPYTGYKQGDMVP